MNGDERKTEEMVPGDGKDNVEQFPGITDNLDELKPDLVDVGNIEFVDTNEVELTHDEDEAKNYDVDRKYVRTKMYRIIEAGDAAITNALLMMKETMGVRELEAASSLIRNTVDALAKLQDSSSTAMKDAVKMRGRSFNPEEDTDKSGRKQGNLSDIAADD